MFLDIYVYLVSRIITYANYLHVHKLSCDEL
jgi:hypothetical protein